jgi:NADH-quinone oxidoreductase subunit E
MKYNPQVVQKILKKYSNEKSSLLAILTDIQTKYNWLPPEALKLVAEKLHVPLIDIYGVASFYHAFSLTPRGKHIVTVCQGTACHVRGAPTVLNRITDRLKVSPGCTTKDDQFTLETVNCLGACALAPIVVVDGSYHGQATTQKVDALIAQYGTKKATKKAKKKSFRSKPRGQKTTKKKSPARKAKKK